MRLSLDEELFLRHWIYDEAHYLEGQGPAKALQLGHLALPADLALLIAAGLPDLATQEAAAARRPAAAVVWPWTPEALAARVAEADAALAQATKSAAGASS